MPNTMQGMRTVVVGGGIKGLIAARLLKERDADVTLLERGAQLGGIHRSIPWDGFKLDAGCHLFGNEDDRTTSLLLDLMRDPPNPVNPVLRSRLNGRITDGIETPDFTSLPASEHQAALAGLIAVAEQRGSGKFPTPKLEQSLEEYLSLRFGAPAAALLDRAIAKLARAPTRELSAMAFSAVAAGRVMLADDAEAKRLKQNPAIDEILLRSSSGDPMQYHREASMLDARCFYPAGGAGAFTENAVARLTGLGVKIRTETPIAGIETNSNGVTLSLANGEALNADLVLWTAGAEALCASFNLNTNLAAQTHKVPLVLFYFDIAEADAGPYSWAQNFDADGNIYRVSIPSRFGKGTAPDGRAYVVAEVPTESTSAIFADPDKYAEAIWDEIISLGVARGTMPEHRHVMKFPVAFRFPKTGYAESCAPLFEKLKQAPRLLLVDEWVFGNSASIRLVDKTLTEIMSNGSLQS